MHITIYGKEGCEKCNEAKKILPASYQDHQALYDDYDLDIANLIVTKSNGQLPIIIIDTAQGRIQLSMAGSQLNGCKDGSCTI